MGLSAMNANTAEFGAYRPDIDGLRAIAVLSVILFHAHVSGFSGGFVGVDVFFVISGFLIGTIVHREVRAQRFSFAKFYVRRAKRILPALFFTLLCVYLAAVLLLTPGELTHFGNNAVATVLAVSNIVLWRGADYFAPAAETNPLLMTWSLGVEEQFYLFFPVLLLVLHRFKVPLFATLAVLCIGSLLLCIKLTATHPSAAFYMLPTRAWELGIGTLLAVNDERYTAWLATRRRMSDALSIVGLGAIAVAVVGFDHDMAFPGAAALVPTIGAALLIVSGNGIVNRRLLSLRAVVFCGLISYSWYLWHWPMLSLARVAANRPLSHEMSFVIAALSFVPAVLSWRFVERPFRTSRATPAPLLWGYAAAVMVFLLPPLLMLVSGGWPSRFATLVTHVEHAIVEEQTDPCLRAYSVSTLNLAPQCVPQAINGKGSEGIALLGDSHAAALAPGVRALAQRQQLSVVELTKSSCPTLAGVSRYMPDHVGHERECAAFSAQAINHVLQDKNIGTVLIAGFWAAPFTAEQGGQRFVRDGDNPLTVTTAQSKQNLYYGLQQTVQTLQAAGKRVMLFKDMPRFNFNPARETQTAYIPARRWLMRTLLSNDLPYRELAARGALENDDGVVDEIFRQLAVQYPQLVIVDPWTRMCNQTGCRFADADIVYYADSQHLSAAGAEFALSGKLLDGHLIADLQRPTN